MVLSDRRKCSSLKFCVVPTKDDSDMVTCIFTRAKFCRGREGEHTCSLEPSHQGLLKLLTWPLSPPALHPPNPWLAAPPYVANLEILAHEEVERGTGMRSDGGDAAAAVSQKPQAEVGTQLRVLFK